MSLITLARGLFAGGRAVATRFATSTAGQAAIGTAGGLAVASQFTSPAATSAVVPFQAQQIDPQINTSLGGAVPIANLSGGRVMMQAPGGTLFMVKADGSIIRPKKILRAGMEMPNNVKDIVFVSADRMTIGVTLKARRKSFPGELQKVARTIQVCKRIVNLCERKGKKRAS